MTLYTHKRLLAGLVAIAVLVIAAKHFTSESFPNIPKDKWQAVFLENNQVYFGKLSDSNAQYVTLTNVFYLRAADSLGANSSQNLNLVKLGGELHGPEDAMYISKAKILFWENLSDTSSVVKTISNSKE